MCHWQTQIPNFCLNHQTITLQGHFRLALHKFRPHLAFLCFGHANFPSTRTLGLDSSNALRNAQRTCQTSESVNKVNPGRAWERGYTTRLASFPGPKRRHPPTDQHVVKSEIIKRIRKRLETRPFLLLLFRPGNEARYMYPCENRHSVKLYT